MSASEPSNQNAINFETLFQSSHIPTILLNANDPVFTVADANKAFLKGTHTERENLIGKPVFEVYEKNPAGDNEILLQIRTAFENVVKTQQPVEIPPHQYNFIDLATGNVTEVYWKSRIIPIISTEGIVTHILHSPINVTAEHKAFLSAKAANKALEAQRQVLFEVFKQAPAGIAILLGSDYVVDMINPLMCELYGRTSEQLLNKPIFSVITEAAGKGFEELLDNVRLTGEPFVGKELEVPLMRQGKIIAVFFNFIYEPFRDVDGNITGVIVVATEVTEQVESKRLLQESEVQFRFMSESMPHQVWSAKSDGQVDYVNGQIQRYLGLTADKIINGNWQDVIHPEDFANNFRIWTDATAKGEAYQIEHRMLGTDGNYRWFLSRALPFRNNGEVVKWLGTNTDIDDQKRNKHFMDGFINSTGNDLKTPLINLKDYIHQLEQTPLVVGERQQFVQKSVRQIKHLENMVNDLLDVSNMLGSGLNYSMQLFDLSKMIIEAVNDAQSAAPEFYFEIAQNPVVRLEGDYDRLCQALGNILSNAVKYSDGDKRVVVRSRNEGHQVLVAVQDFGIGIPQHHLDKVFERFYRVDQENYADSPGLGLYMVAEIVKRHQGNYWVESELGKGSTFFFTLPLD